MFFKPFLGKPRSLEVSEFTSDPAKLALSEHDFLRAFRRVPKNKAIDQTRVYPLNCTLRVDIDAKVLRRLGNRTSPPSP